MHRACSHAACFQDTSLIGVGKRGAGRRGFFSSISSTPWGPGLSQAWLPGGCGPVICPSSYGPRPVLQAEGWVLPSWFQLGTRKLVRGIFSPGFWRSQRSFILGDSGHSGTQLANAGLLGCSTDGLRGRAGGQGGEGASVTLLRSVAGGEVVMPAQAVEVRLLHTGRVFAGPRAPPGAGGGPGGDLRPASSCPGKARAQHVHGMGLTLGAWPWPGSLGICS